MPKYFEDLSVGQVFTSPGRTVTECDIVSFAGLSGDFNQLHTDREFAAATRFGEPIAHGLLGLSIATGLITRTGVFDGTGIALLGIAAWRFNEVIRAGDTIRVELEITGLKETSKPSVGFVDRTIRIVNQRGVTVQKGRLPALVQRRPEG